ncbi:hypothetical protein D9758_001645 [Tetrapyrgos nigripes]|uniref:Uncharacterized protein n=1 Tax=Tetrapyrgos nigripes TaxID=182062 RepID=A0A8H5GY06_9AGAR|nr:hypothetical protein D9758_001645 [Tetrapyrgos nigripes]
MSCLWFTQTVLGSDLIQHLYPARCRTSAAEFEYFRKNFLRLFVPTLSTLNDFALLEYFSLCVGRGNQVGAGPLTRHTEG